MHSLYSVGYCRGYESGSGAGGCGFLCWNKSKQRRVIKVTSLYYVALNNKFLKKQNKDNICVCFCCEQVKGGTPVRARRGASFALFGDCGKTKKRERKR